MSRSMDRGDEICTKPTPANHRTLSPLGAARGTVQEQDPKRAETCVKMTHFLIGSVSCATKASPTAHEKRGMRRGLPGGTGCAEEGENASLDSEGGMREL